MDAYGLADISAPSKQPTLPGMGSGDEDSEEGEPDEAKPNITLRGGSRSPKYQSGTKATEEATKSKEDPK
jgi:hypothetical protein